MIAKHLFRLGLLVSCAIAQLSAGVLTGDQVNVTHFFPDTLSVYDNLGTQSIPNGHYVYQGGVYTVDVYENYIDMTFECYGCNWGQTTFNGPVIERLSSAAFTGVTIDGTTAYSGFNASRLSFTSNKIFVDLNNLSINGFIRLNLEGETASAEAPEPATLGMFGLGIVSIGLYRRRRARS